MCVILLYVCPHTTIYVSAIKPQVLKNVAYVETLSLSLIVSLFLSFSFSCLSLSLFLFLSLSLWHTHIIKPRSMVVLKSMCSHTVVWEHIYIWGHIYSSMRTHIVVCPTHTPIKPERMTVTCTWLSRRAHMRHTTIYVSSYRHTITDMTSY